MLNEAFNLISEKVEEAVKPQGFTKVKIQSTDENELVSLFTSETMAYSVIYYKDKQHTLLRECGMTDDGPDNEWKTLATWLFDPDHDTLKEAASIANDFCDAISAPSAVKKIKQAKKTKKSDDGNADKPEIRLPVNDTAYATLQLEVYYRHLPTFKTPEIVETPTELDNSDDIGVDIVF